ncbi:MAG: DUF488 domain-containing protein [Planctomycetota bacterium]|nr:DUF488 domain-containing protein [Planctomycetota bacterium]
MLTRQKCLLYMIERAGRAVGHLELTKWAFLVARETRSAGGGSFYDFVPYLYGPFSFTLFREADTLVREGYLRETKDGKAWERGDGANGNTDTLSPAIRFDVAGVVERFARRASDELVDYVYTGFPWYTANSRIKRLAERQNAMPAVYTVGYERWSVDRLLDEVMLAGISRIIDVRSNPVARRYGFHRSSLSRVAGKVGLEYVHVPEVGIPSSLRHDLDGMEDYDRLFDHYTNTLLPSQPDAVRRVSDLVIQKASVLLCMEADPALCHRTRLAAIISSMTHLPVRDIRGIECGPITS